MVTFTSYGRADQVQIFLLLRRNCKLLIMPSDAAGVWANGNLGTASLPPRFLLQLSSMPPLAHPLRGLNLIDLTTALCWNKCISTTLLVPNTQTRYPNVFPGLSFLLLLTSIYFRKWNGQYLGIYIIHKTERGREEKHILYSAILFHLRQNVLCQAKWVKNTKLLFNS